VVAGLKHQKEIPALAQPVRIAPSRSGWILTRLGRQIGAMPANFDPYRRYKPTRLGIHVSVADDLGEPVTVRNYDLPSPQLARMRFDAARLACRHPAGDKKSKLVVELISGGNILDSFSMRRDTLPSLSAIVTPPPTPIPGRYRVDLCASGRMVDGPECELGRADTIPAAAFIYDHLAGRHSGRLVVLRDSIVGTGFAASVMRRSDGKPRDLMI
jgi:hypothetical protein